MFWAGYYQRMQQFVFRSGKINKSIRFKNNPTSNSVHPAQSISLNKLCSCCKMVGTKYNIRLVFCFTRDYRCYVSRSALANWKFMFVSQFLSGKNFNWKIVQQGRNDCNTQLYSCNPIKRYNNVLTYVRVEICPRFEKILTTFMFIDKLTDNLLKSVFIS